MIHGLNLSAETSLFQTKITEVYVKNQIINHIYRILEQNILLCSQLADFKCLVINFKFFLFQYKSMKPQGPGGNSLKDKRRAFQNQLKQGQIIAGKYQVLQQVGQGVSSVVIKARQIQTGQIVAIKKIKSFLANIHQSTRVLRQIILLRHLKHPNIIQLKQVIVQQKQSVTLYLILQYQQKDIKKIFFSNKILTLQEIKKVVFQVLLGLKYCHECQVLHRDLKPQNILTNVDLSEIKLCDFGLARTVILDQLQTQYSRIKSQLSALGIKKETNTKEIKTSNLSIHVATRWYRAPQLILLEKKYNSAIDIWSVGCILGQLLCMMQQNSQNVQNRRPLFPGKACYPLSPPKTPDMNYQRINDFPHSVYDQLSMIFQVIGTPQDISYITDQRAKHYLKSFGKIDKTPFKEIFKYLPVEVQDFLQKTLKFNPNQRLTVVDALNHPLFEDIRPKYKHYQQIIGKPFYFELTDLTKEQIYKMVLQQQECYQNQMKEEEKIGKIQAQSEMVPE